MNDKCKVLLLSCPKEYQASLADYETDTGAIFAPWGGNELVHAHGRVWKGPGHHYGGKRPIYEFDVIVYDPHDPVVLDSSFDTPHGDDVTPKIHRSFTDAETILVVFLNSVHVESSHLWEENNYSNLQCFWDSAVANEALSP